ncbi:hypothetical protein [Pigmentiphaga daeguensis]|uniref:Uncharacterized protein n=1 Tax=Pigmentiphaga daeguensis TaxID=414049 RepID=A0ABN1D4A9_9BURK
MAEILARIGTVQAFPSPREFVFKPWSVFKQRYDYVFLNWIESLVFNGPNGEISFSRALLLGLYLFAIRLANKKLVWIRHNNYPHHIKTDKNKMVAKKFLDHLESAVDIVITHSPLEARDRKRFYVPHPLYQTELSAINPVPFKNYFFIFGHIAPYKKLAEAINLLPDEANLVVAGPIKDTAYFEKCQRLAADKQNVLLMPGFLDSPTAARIATDSRGLLVLNADTDMVVSGSYIYALSLGIPLYAVNTPFIEWLSNGEHLAGIRAFENITALFCSLDPNKFSSLRPDPQTIESLFGDETTLKRLNHALAFSKATI